MNNKEFSYKQEITDDGLVWQACYYDGVLIEEKWSCNNAYLDYAHRDNDKPAVINYKANTGNKRLEIWAYRGQMCRDGDKPAEIYYHENGNIEIEVWHKNSFRNRDDGPAMVYYATNGKAIREVWYQNGTQHRENGPADISYDNDGHIIVELWYQNGLRHREDGPASTRYEPAFIRYKNNNLLLKVQDYYLNNVNVPDWLVMTPAEDLNPNDFFYFDNVEQSREFVKRIGIERMIDVIGRIVDEKDNYSLINLRISLFTYRPYLKMINPSTGDVHIEGVHPSCFTVQQALNWRNGRNDQPAQIT